MKRLKKVVYITAILGICLWLPKAEVYAAQGTVTFGSESYSWYTGEVCPLGVYVKSDAGIESYEICLEYDESMLRYLNGADSVEGNRVYLSGTGQETVYKTMLHFEPLKEGNTEVTVVSATCVTAGDISSGDLTQPIEMTQLSVAPITVQKTVSNRLQNILVDGQALEAFLADTFVYYLEVEGEVERLNLSYEAADAEAVVTISDTSLQTGENEITILVKGTAEEESVYTLYVTRKEEPVLPKETEEALESQPEDAGEDISGTEIEGEKIPDTEMSGTETADTEIPVMEVVLPEMSVTERWTEVFLENPVLWSLVMLVAILCLLYGMVFLKNRRKNRLPVTEEEEVMKIINLEQTVIDVRHVTMQFKMAQDEASSLKEYLIRAVKGQNRYQYLTALNDISFEVKQGDVVGIIGTNGSGKSTLLKIVSGALTPTDGYVETDRSKVQMLTLGTGFDMELTARENVYLNGAIIGYSKEYIDEKYDEIVEFAELNGFMEERMKNFSSGMVSRLGFAIATMRDTPDILILDEVLSVGDMFFREKSMARIRQMIHGGATVLIVSHSTDVIMKNCNRAVWIEKGVLQMVGEPKEVCQAYRNYEVQE